MDTDTTNQETQQPAQPEPQRAGNLMFGPPEERPKTGPTYQDRLAEARRIMEEGGNPLEVLTRREAEPAPATAEGDPAPADPAEQQPAEAAAFEPPPGYVLQPNGQYRGPDGRFYSEDQVRALAQDEQVAPAPAEGDAEPVEEEQAEAAEADATDEPQEALVTVSLPGRRPEDPDEEVQVPAAAAEAINRLRNGYMRKEEFRRQMEDVNQARAELQAVQTRLRYDPENFLIEHIPAERRASVVKHLLADDAVWNVVVEDLAKWDQNELERRAAWAELQAERLRQSREAEAQIAEERAIAENALQIRDAIGDMVPDGMDPQRADLFRRYAIRDLQQYVNEHGINRLDPAEVPILLHRLGTLQAFGIPLPASPAPQANGRTIGGQTAVPQPAPANRPAARPTGPAGNGVASAAPARDPGAVFRAQAERRAAAAAVAPAGVGAAPARPRPPEGQTVKERIAWARQNLAR